MQDEKQFDSSNVETLTQPEVSSTSDSQVDEDVIEVVTIVKSCAYDPLTRL